MHCAYTHNHKQNMILFLLLLFTEAVWQPWGKKTLGKHYAHFRVTNIKTGATVQGAVAAGWRPVNFYTLAWYAQCIRLPRCVQFHTSTSDGMFPTNALDSLSHSLQVSQTASLHVERVVNGTVLPVGGHSCRTLGVSVGLAQLT